MPGRAMSYEYLARPVTLSGPSSRLMDVPISTGFSGHLYLSGTRGAGAAGPGGFCALATSHPLGFHRRLQNSDEGAAAADVAVEPLLGLFDRWIGGPLEQRHGRHDESRCAEPAHEAVRVAEGLLHRVQRVTVREGVHGTNLFALYLDRQRRTGIHRPTVNDHRAGAAGAT